MHVFLVVPFRCGRLALLPILNDHHHHDHRNNVRVQSAHRRGTLLYFYVGNYDHSQTMCEGGRGGPRG